MGYRKWKREIKDAFWLGVVMGWYGALLVIAILSIV